LSPWPEEKLKFRKPQNKYEWSLWVAAVLILISKISKYIFVHNKLQLPAVQYLVFFISLTGWTLLLVTGMRAGVQLLRSDSTAKKGRIFIIATGFLFLFQIGSSSLSIYAMSYMTGLGTQMSREAGIDIPKTLALPDLAPESRERLGRSFAQIKYIQDGVIMDYATASGAKGIYKPTDEDILMRRGRVETFQAIRYEKIILAYWCVLFMVTSATLLRKKKAL
jgi:hypothetical protein